MHKAPKSTTPVKSKGKGPTLSPPLKKGVSKVRDKLTPYSPRSTRPLLCQPSPQINRKNKNSTDIDSTLQSPLRSIHNNLREKGYETPKFKCEPELTVPKSSIPHNFFSFGTREAMKVGLKGLRGKENQRTSQRVRKETRLR